MFAPSQFPIRRVFLGVFAAFLSVSLAGCFDEVPEPKSTKEKTPADAAPAPSDWPTRPAAEVKVTTDPPAKVMPVPARPEPIVRPYSTPAPLAEEPSLSKVVIRDKREWDLPEAAARSLGKIGAAAVPELTKDLNDRDPEIRERAANVLARIGPAAKQAVPDLIAALEDDDEAVRRSAAIALGQIGPAAAAAVPALMRAMKEPGETPKAP